MRIFSEPTELVVAMRKRLSLASISVILLAWLSCCLVICTKAQREPPIAVEGADRPAGGLDEDERISGARLRPDIGSEAGLLQRQDELVRVSSELCAEFPHKCRQG